MLVMILQKYYHGESIAINVVIDNNTNKTVKKLKVSGELEQNMVSPVAVVRALNKSLNKSLTETETKNETVMSTQAIE
jgi:hypothetical protein